MKSSEVPVSVSKEKEGVRDKDEETMEQITKKKLIKRFKRLVFVCNVSMFI